MSEHEKLTSDVTRADAGSAGAGEARYRLSRQWARDLTYYVAQVPGDGGKDWGYTENPSKAALVSAYWMRRFISDCEHVGAAGNALEVSL